MDDGIVSLSALTLIIKPDTIEITVAASLK